VLHLPYLSWNENYQNIGILNGHLKLTLTYIIIGYTYKYAYMHVSTYICIPWKILEVFVKNLKNTDNLNISNTMRLKTDPV